MNRRNANLQLFGLLGCPLAHTLSPAMHEAGFSRLAIKAFYLVLELDEAHFRRAMAGLKTFLLEGFNVTVPYKETVIPYLTELTPKACAIGAVNTVFRKGKKWVGTNTDSDGFLMALQRDARFRPRGKRALILGAGGAARAAAYALAASGAEKIVLTDLYKQKPDRVVSDFSPVFPRTRLESIPCEPEHLKKFLRETDLVVNATTMGLKLSDPAILAPSWIPAASGGRKILFYDVIYQPFRTKFLNHAARRGHPVINGLGMLLYQGVRAFEIWTGEKAPVEAMRRGLKKALKEREKKR